VVEEIGGAPEGQNKAPERMPPTLYKQILNFSILMRLDSSLFFVFFF
jgi:hypothetical protein